MAEQDEAKQLNGKPDWATAPEWAKWLAQNADGEWHWYQLCPVVRALFFQYAGGASKHAGTGQWNLEYYNTLERRPSKQERK